MMELREVFEMVTNKTEPDLDSWKQQEDRQRRSSRNRRMAVLALVAAFAIVVGVFALTTRPDTGPTPQTEPPSSPAQPLTAATANGPIVARLDGTIVRLVQGLPDDAFALSLANDGTIAFVTAVDSENTIATIGIDGQGMRTLVPGEEPALSQDGTRIAFVRNDDIYVMDVDGSNVRPLVAAPHRDEFPQWSPDGETVVYDNLGASPATESGFSDTSVIMSVPASGGTPTQVSSKQQSSEPSYSPDGSRIAFRSHGDVWVVNTDGTGAVDIATYTSGSTDRPRWSPDGTRIAYTDYSPAYRPDVVQGADSSSAPIEFVKVVDVATKQVTRVGRLGLAGFSNAPQWISNDRLLLLVSAED